MMLVKTTQNTIVQTLLSRTPAISQKVYQAYKPVSSNLWLPPYLTILALISNLSQALTQPRSSNLSAVQPKRRENSPSLAHLRLESSASMEAS